MTDKSFLFVGGCPRSGTTALARALNAHEDLLIGDERYMKEVREGRFTPDLFTREEFLSREKPMKHSYRGAEKPDVAAAYDRVTVIGEKIPKMWPWYNEMRAQFPDARFLCIIRNPTSVAESYEARKADDQDGWNRSSRVALTDWNRSIRGTLKAIDAGIPITVVCNERLYSSEESFARLFEALGFSIDGADRSIITGIVEQYAQSVRSKSQPRDDNLRMQLMLNADFAGYRRLVNKHCILRDAVSAELELQEG